MKSSAAQPKVIVKAGSVSLSEARAAARAAKTPAYLRLVKAEPDKDSELWKRYLGHFGGGPRKATARLKPRKTAAKKTSSRKRSARKAAKKR
jgi:hypothetical protein